MASDLIPFTLSAPGFYGLNTQDSPVSLSKEFALVASNAVIDKLGRLAARKGWTNYVEDSSAITNTKVWLLHEFINSAGDIEQLAVVDFKVCKVVNNAYEVLYDGSTVWTGQNWKAVNFNDKVYFFQKNHVPMVYDGDVIVPMTSHSNYDGTVQNANEVLSAYGRLWNIDATNDRVTLQWSDTLIGEDYNGGLAGSLNLEKIFTNGTRPAVALAAFNGFLIVFCDKSILVFTGADEDPTTNIAIQDIIDGVGCISRDSVVDVGTDILFLSDTGVRSLGRIIDQKSAPIFDVSANVRDNLMADVVANNSNETIKAVYNDVEGFYLLSLPELGKTYCFDLKKRLEESVCRVTTWTLAPYCFCFKLNKDMLMGFDTGVGKYETYTDNGAGYLFSYLTSYLSNANSEFDGLTDSKILKSLRLAFYGKSGYTINFGWGFNYQGISRSANKVSAYNVASDEYNEDEYFDAEYSGNQENLSFQTVKQQLSGSGTVYQIGIGVQINGGPFSIQQLDVFSKKGRLSYE